MIILVQVAASVAFREKIVYFIPQPGIVLTISVGSVFLFFRAAEDSNSELTWSFVEMIIKRTLDDVRKGWPSQFKSEWYHAEDGQRIWVSLSMLQRFGPGPQGLN